MAMQTCSELSLSCRQEPEVQHQGCRATEREGEGEGEGEGAGEDESEGRGPSAKRQAPGIVLAFPRRP